jgi:hypothetical protein
MSRDNALPEDAGFSALENALTRAGGQFRQRAGGRPLPAFDFARLDAAPAMEAPSAETELPFNEPALRGVEKLFARAGQEIREAAALRASAYFRPLASRRGAHGRIGFRGDGASFRQNRDPRRREAALARRTRTSRRRPRSAFARVGMGTPGRGACFSGFGSRVAGDALAGIRPEALCLAPGLQRLGAGWRSRCWLDAAGGRARADLGLSPSGLADLGFA